jgi:ADP-ribosylglycohydrolase
MKDKIFGGILGLCVADALGVPVEFESRESLAMNPVTDMRGYGTHNQPSGTWSDDTSTTLCLTDSLTGGLDYYNIMRKFRLWMDKGEYTPYGNVFDIGIATRKAIQRFAGGTEPLMCGGTSEYDNGNGSLMRILPLVFYLINRYKTEDDFFKCVHNVSSLTHAHKRSMIACGIYMSVARNILLEHRITNNGISEAKKYYSEKVEYADELKIFQRIFNDDYINLP